MAAVIAVTTFTAVPVPETAHGHIETKNELSGEIAGSDTEKAVRTYFSDIPVMIQVARCESHFRHTLVDGSVLRGRVDRADIGVMQINTRYHAATAAKLDLDLSNLHDNMAYARYLYKKQGTQPWRASAACWQRTLAQA